VLQRVAACCTELQRVVVCCSVWSVCCSDMVVREGRPYNVSDSCVAVCCSALQCGQCLVVIWCSVRGALTT